MNFFRKKSFESVQEYSATSGLSKTLGSFDLILLGLGIIIGTGIFVITGIVAAKYSGPAIMISYVIAGVACIPIALAYTELATMLPTSGSIYTYSYIAFGEIFALLIGSLIVLELGFASAIVAVGWSGYVQAILEAGGIYLPKMFITIPAKGGIINLPAFLITILMGFVLYFGTKESKKFNAILVFVKMAAIFMFIIFATPHFNATNWKNFLPFGFNNVIIGASVLFLAFNGFNLLATTAEECKNPKRNLVVGIIGSLVITTIIYVIVAGLVTGIVPFDQLNNDQPLAYALTLNNSKVGSAIVATGAVCGMMTVLMMSIYSMSRIVYVIARDRLLPQICTTLHPKYDSPYITIIIFSAIVALLGGFCQTEFMTQICSIAILIEYISAVIIVMLFRIKLPNIPRPFKCPSIFIMAPIALVTCVYMLSKQILGDDLNLSVAGQAIIGWFILMLMLYIFRSFFIKQQV